MRLPCLLSADTALDTWYNLSVRLDGSRLEVWRGTAGGTMELLGALNSVTMMSSAYIQLQTLSVSRYWVDDVVFTTADPHSATYAYNDANEMTSMTEDGVTTSFTYDDWGRLSTKTQGSYEAEYFYRYGDKLKMVTSTFPGEAALVEYMYDGLGKRRIKVVNSSEWTWYRWDLGWNVLAEYADYPGTTSIWDVGALERTYTHTPGGSVSRILGDVGGTAPATGNYQYYFHDHLGSARALHNQSKAMIASNEHTPYGDVYAASGAPMPHTFTGKSYDAEAGLYYFPYRYYSPGMGRWTTRDPLGMVDGANMYGYVNARVSVNKDLLGLSIRDTYPGPGPYGEDCLLKAYHIADHATGATSSIRHCVAVCEAKRCLGSIGGILAAYIANRVFEALGPSSEDSDMDIVAGDDAVNISAPKCDEDNDDYCTEKCRERGW
ncbi:MAG: RHS repeat-associated core domain-containing protein [Candidatus Hydrogenedentes bacterium]|nr:RHS repeat-associated core domain-containing protein [Candidatus Hydrogenedentota bacterium]